MGPLTLVFLAITLNSVASRLLYGAAWTRRAPGLAVLMWQAITASVLTAALLAGAALMVPSLPASASVTAFLKACTSAVREQYGSPAGQAVGVFGGLVAGGILLRTLYCIGIALSMIRAGRVSQLQHLSLTARPHPRWPISVVEHTTAVAYCIPGRNPRIIFTSAAIARLDDDQTAAVIAHERAHLRGRHDVVLALFDGLARAFPGLASMKLAGRDVPKLLEMRADDVALLRNGRLALASALVGLSEASVPMGTVAATSSAMVRLRRMADAPPPLRRSGGVCVAAVSIAVLLAPLAIVAEPAIAATWISYCPIDLVG